MAASRTKWHAMAGVVACMALSFQALAAAGAPSPCTVVCSGRPNVSVACWPALVGGYYTLLDRHAFELLPPLLPPSCGVSRRWSNQSSCPKAGDSKAYKTITAVIEGEGVGCSIKDAVAAAAGVRATAVMAFVNNDQVEQRAIGADNEVRVLQVPLSGGGAELLAAITSAAPPSTPAKGVSAEMLCRLHMPPEMGWSGVAEEAVGRIEALSQTGHRQWVLGELERLMTWSIRLQKDIGSLEVDGNDGHPSAAGEVEKDELAGGIMGLTSDLRQRLAKALVTVDRPFEALAVLRYPAGHDARSITGHMGSAEEGLLRADFLVGVGEWEEAGRVYQTVWGEGQKPNSSAAGMRLAVLCFARGDVAEAWRVWAQLTPGEREGEGLELLWLVERELRLLFTMFPSGYPFPTSSSEEAQAAWQGECGKAGSPVLEALYSHLLAMTFLDELGAMDASLRHLDHAMRLCPSRELYLRRLLATPIVFPSHCAMATQRRELLQALQPDRLIEAARFPDRGPPEKAPHLMFSATPAHMFIGYQAMDDHTAQKVVTAAHLSLYPDLSTALIPHHSTTTSLSPLGSPSSSYPAPQSPADSRIRVGFLSSFLYSHSVGRLLYEVITRLDRQRFHVHLFHVSGHGPPEDDPIYRSLRNSTSTSREGLKDDVHVVLPSGLEEAGMLVAGHRLDILFFPEIGMDTHTYLLAYRRLARVQAVFWGHPISHGLPSIDFFLTSGLFEPTDPLNEDGDRYHEQRVLLDSIGTFFPRPSLPTSPPSAKSLGRESFGLFPDAHVYTICQTLMKFHVEMDAMMAQVLRQDPRAVIVITYNTAQRMWRHQLEQRFRRTVGVELCRRVFFLPSLKKENFYALLRVTSVALDTYPFGGGVTALEALAAGAIVVTIPSLQTVPQLAAGMLRRMGLYDMISSDIDGYVQRAVRLANDAEFRSTELGRLHERLDNLYEDTSVITEWETLIERLSVS